jgi:hypothetical protein
MCCIIHGFHAWEFVRIWCRKVHLKWAAQELLFSQKIQELGVIFCTPSDKVHGPSIGSAELDFLAAIVEFGGIFIGY